MLYGTSWSAYIASGSGSQAEQTFTTLEKLANDRIDSMVGSTCESTFKAEVEIKNAAGDGFSHSSDGFSYTLFNGSFTKTLNSNVDRKRGARARAVLFDECSWLGSDMLEVFKAFTIVDSNFKTGFIDGKSLDKVRVKSMPKEPGNQLIYISSASSIETPFYTIYRDSCKRMLMGDRRYFVACIDCDQLTKPLMNGKPVAPLLTQETISEAMRTNPEKARREYYCQFTTDAGEGAIIKRAEIMRNEEIRAPLLYNDTGDRKFVLAYDPARSRDRSIISVGEIYDSPLPNGQTEKKMRIVNCVSLVDVNKKKKTPMQTPEQIEYLKKMILDYNGGADGYANILGVYCDQGSGGAGVNIMDFLMPDWEDQITHEKHRGLIDKEYSAEYVKKFPNAVDKIRMIEPSKYKSEIYEALIEMVSQNKISFTSTYDNRDYLTVFDKDDKKTEENRKKLSEKIKKEELSEEEYKQEMSADELKTKTIHLNSEEKRALATIDLMKEEICHMSRIPRATGKDSFELAPEVRNTMHDDASYTAALLAYALMLERRKQIIPKKKSSANIMDALHIRAPRKVTRYDRRG